VGLVVGVAEVVVGREVVGVAGVLELMVVGVEGRSALLGWAVDMVNGLKQELGGDPGRP
jgi:hypothetical protein